MRATGPRNIETALLLGLCCLTAASIQGQPPPTGPNRPNFVVLLVDNVRKDEFSAGGHPYLETPNIDRLAAEGALFRSFYVTTPLCSPSRASIMTGQYGSRHGIVDNSSRSRASHELHSFAQDLQKLGYETAFLGKWHMGNDPTTAPAWTTGSATRARDGRPIPTSGRTVRSTKWRAISPT